MDGVEIGPVDPRDQRQVDQWLAVRQAAQDADSPHLPRVTPAPAIVGLLRGSRHRRVEQWVAQRAGEVLAAAELYFFLRDNRHLADVELCVAPDRRRQGIGTALRAHIEAHAAAAGRDTVVSFIVDGLAGGAPRPVGGQRFAEAAGYTRELDEVHRVVDLSAVDEPGLGRLLAEAWPKAAGYELVRWAGVMPEEIVDGAAYLNGRMNLDAPIGGLDLEQEAVDADRIREGEQLAAAKGILRLGTVARQVRTGQVAGYTEIEVFPGDEEHCCQENTIVDPGHRGHRLGVILKIENQRQLRSYRPRMRYVHTWNAESNAHMIAINEAVGYRPVDRWIAYQKKLAGVSG